MMTNPDTSTSAEKLADWFGDRCADYDAECSTCRAWDAFDAAIARAENAEARAAELEKYSTRLLDDVDDIIAHSRGVSGLHLNDDVAEWSSLTTGGEFEEWLKSLEWLRTALAGEGGQ